MSTTQDDEDVVEARIYCGEAHPEIPDLFCARLHPHDPPCRGIEPHSGMPKAWRAQLQPDDAGEELARERARGDYYEQEYEAACERVRELTVAADDLRSQRGQRVEELGAVRAVLERCRAVLERCRAVLGNNALSDEELVDRVAQFAYLDAVIYRLLAKFATPVPANVTLVDHLTTVLRAHADQTAELIRSGAEVGLRIDGDLVHSAVLDACPDLLTQQAAERIADKALGVLANIDEVTVLRLRGPDSAPWTPPAQEADCVPR